MRHTAIFNQKKQQLCHIKGNTHADLVLHSLKVGGIVRDALTKNILLEQKTTTLNSAPPTMQRDSVSCQNIDYLKYGWSLIIWKVKTMWESLELVFFLMASPW